MLENVKALGQLYFRPAAAMSDLLDRGSMGAAAILVMVVTALLLTTLPPSISPEAIQYAQIQRYGSMMPPAAMAALKVPPPIEQFVARTYTETSFYTALLMIAVLVVPSLILGAIVVDGAGSFSFLLQRDYGALFTCASMAWAATFLPIALVMVPLGRAYGATAAAGLLALGILFFGVLLAIAVQVVLGSELPRALIVSVIGLAGLGAGFWFDWNVGASIGLLFSPFLLYLMFIAYRQSGSDLLQLGSGLRRRQSFQRYLETCTINPADSDAQYQLGLIYQQRRQFEEATARFRRAIEINPSETDAHFQLGRIARQQGRLDEALRHFQTVVDQDPKHSSHEVWREVGAMHLAAGRADVAHEELAHYLERRPFDPEGLCYMGQTLEKLGQAQKAAESYKSAIESVRTAPAFRRGPLSRWSRLAQRELKKLKTR